MRVLSGLFFRTIAGAVAGLLAWIIWEPSAPNPYTEAWGQWELRLQLTAFLLIGLTIGAVSGWSKGSKLHALREGGLGALFGVIGGSLGMSIATELIKLYGHSPGEPGLSIVISTTARILALTPIATLLGTGIGASTLSLRGLVQGTIGGFIAGGVTGATFDSISGALAKVMSAGATAGHGVEIGGPARAVYFTVLGLCIALFIGLAERVLRSAWVRLPLGRNEGKEWVVDRPEMLIGRSETANIPLFGDPNIAPKHAYILSKGGAYYLADAGSPMGVFLNGQRVSQAPLFHGAHIQVGSTILEFLMRAGAAPVRAPEAYAGAYPAGGVGSVAYAPQPGVPGGYAQPQPVPQAMTQGYQPAAIPMNPTVAAPGPLQPTQMGGMPGPAPTVAGPRFTLVALDGPLNGQRFGIGGPVELGRESASIPMGYDTQASRRHATLSPGAFDVTVTDNNSTNGTFVNGSRVTQATARSGDVVRVGQTSFRIEAV